MLELEIVTPKGIIQPKTRVNFVSFPGYQGQLTVLEGHHPLVTLLTSGPCEFSIAGSSQIQRLFVTEGYAQVEPHYVAILAEQVWRPDELDLSALRQKLTDLENKILVELVSDQTRSQWEGELILIRKQIEFLLSEQPARSHHQ